MNTSRALFAGAVGGAVMSVLMALARSLLALDMNLEMLMGTMLLAPGTAAWLLGLAMHLMLSAGIALGYAWAFETVTRRASAGLGAAFSLVHMAAAGVMMGAAIPAVHRLVPEQMAGPGFFLANHGTLGVAAFVMLHLAFGATVGALYAGHVRRGG